MLGGHPGSQPHIQPVDVGLQRTHGFGVDPLQCFGQRHPGGPGDVSQTANERRELGVQFAYGAIVFPGSLDRSYLWGKITGTVPGSRMPLANGPVTNHQYIALACWIEGLSTTEENRATDFINYSECSFAEDPEDLEISDF